MKLTPSLLFTCFLISISSLLFAQSININTAKEIAKNHLLSVGKNNLKSASPNQSKFQFSSLSVTSESKDTLYFVLNDTIDHSFVIVAADKRSRPIIGYSLESSYNVTNQPPAFVEWMENRKKEIESIKKNNLKPDSATVASWQNLSLKSATTTSSSVEPLIQTKWDQGCYYNSMCPTDAAGPCGHAYTGCTITAMAQIMKYWNYPTKGTGSHSYSHLTYGNLSADFGSTTYQWSQMPSQVTGQNDAVATLMYHCGVSLDTDYGPYATGANDPRDALVQYFNYSSNAMLVNRSGFTTSEWINLLKSELDLRHPIWYTGNGGSVGHAFICDGYQDSDYFHFNWGWSGSSDGYFYIGNLNPGWYSFNENQYALINLLPGSLPDGYNGFFLSSNALDIFTKGGTASVDICSSTNWTVSSDQSWLSLSTNTGVSGKTTLTLTATENQTGSDRSAIITISAAGFSNQTITVNQFTKVNVTPGGLRNLISKNASVITKLTLSGTIDARDFKTMRDAMPALTDLDLSNVTIVAYSGSEGTINETRTYPANEIPAATFYINPCQGQNLLKTVIFPATITSIGSNAFGYSKYLTTINIPSSVTNIASGAFHPCSAFINVDPNNPNFSSIDGVLFNKNQTTIIQCPVSKTGNYTIPSTVTSIMELTFYSCIKLTTVTIPSSVFSIGSYAFYECSGLKTVFIPSSVNSIENEVFRNCSALINVDANNPNYSSIDGVLFNKTQTKLIQCPILKTDNYTIPSSVTSIGRYAFSNCSGLKSITIPSTVTTIEFCAFNECRGLTNITIPSSITTIEYGVFNFCKGLRSISIPSSVTSIGGSAFCECSQLDSIFVYFIPPVNLNTSAGVFYNVNKNTCKLYVPYGSKASFQVASEWKDFTNIVEMPGIFLSNNSISMDSNANTVRITISSNSDWTATSDQTWLAISPSDGVIGRDSITITALANPTTVIRKATVTISAPGLDSQTIKVTQFSKIVVTAGNLKEILAGQLSTITGLTLTGIIDARDFKTMRDEMPALTDVDLSDVTIAAYTGTEGTCPLSWGITTYLPNEVPRNAFQDNRNLTTVTIPSSAITIGSFAFNNSGLTAIIIPPSVTSINLQAFRSFEGMIAVDINNPNYSAIDGVLFNKTQTEIIKCPISKTGSYTIPSSVITINYDAFCKCKGLTSISIPPSVTTIRNAAFEECLGLLTIDIPSSVTLIGDFAFYCCPSLTSVTIPSSVTTIRDYAFSNCAKLNSIYAYRLTPVSLFSSSNAFLNVNRNTCTLYVPYGTTALYASADQWKDFKNIVEMQGAVLSTNTVIMEANTNTAKVNISSSANWTATSDQPWLTINTTSGTTGSNTITFTATSNPGSEIRTATVTVSVTGLASQTITVTQFIKVNAVVTAGNLKTNLAKQLSTISNLSLTGTIDARDFKTMRDEMPALTDIDLSGVIIVAYTGTEGTIEGYDPNNGETVGFSNTYPSNTIAENAFYTSITGLGKTFLKSIILPSSATSIGPCAFCRCKNLTNIIIPPSVTSIGIHAFGYFEGLITVDSKNLEYSAIDGVLFKKNQTELIQCPVSKTGSYTIPSSVITINSFAFYNCTDLTTIIIPPSVISVMDFAFAECHSLGSINLPSSLSLIRNDAFFNCNSLTSVTIPSSITTMEYSIFNNCTKLSSIYVYRYTPLNISSSPYVFSNVNKNTCILYVPYGSKALYAAADQWKDFTNIVEVQIPNHAPVANAGNDCATIEGILVTLNGTGSADADGNSLTYKWTAPPGITLSSETVSKPTFVAPEVTSDTNYTFSLIVNDGLLNSTEDQVIITVKQVNKRPIADAGTDQSVNENGLCTLDGSSSSDPDNDKLTYLWTAPIGITLSSKTAQKPTFIAKEVTTDTNYTFSLVVNDGLQNSIEDQVIVTVKNVDKAPYVKNPIENISVEKKSPDQSIYLRNVFFDDDLNDVLSYSVTSNTNNQVVTPKIAGAFLSLSFSTQYTGSSEIVITATSNGKEVTSKFNVEVKIPTGIDPLDNDQELMVFPNPTNGKIKLAFNQIRRSGTELIVTDTNGKIVLKQIIQEKEGWIDLSGNPPGLYLLKTNLKNTNVQKVILK